MHFRPCSLLNRDHCSLAHRPSFYIPIRTLSYSTQLPTIAQSQSQSQPTHYNALILGSGQSGTPLATHLSTTLHQSVCLVERSHIAGCCVNEGCTPTKTMVASGRVAYLARRAGDYGVLTTKEGDRDGEGIRVDMQKVRQRKRDIVSSFRGGSERRLKNAGVDVVMGEARFVAEKEVVVKLNGWEGDGDGEEKRFTADKVYINVGCRPSRPEIPGLDSIEASRILDSTSIQELGEVPEHLVVIGGGYIGVEFGQLFSRLGARVTIVHRGERLLSKVDDPQLVECMQDILREDGVDIIFNASSTKISVSEDPNSPIHISITTKEAEKAILHASHILLATGRVPNTESLNLAAAGIKTSLSGHIVASSTLETSVEGVYVMGDVKGGPAFTHVSYDDFRIIRDNLALQASETGGELKTTNVRASITPSVVYTDPQFAHVGPKWGELSKGRTVITYSMPGSWIARGLETEETRGMLKAVVDPWTDEIISFSAVSVEGGELMAVVQMAMLGGTRWQQLQDMIFAHPSWSEALNNLWGGDKKEVMIK